MVRCCVTTMQGIAEVCSDIRPNFVSILAFVVLLLARFGEDFFMKDGLISRHSSEDTLAVLYKRRIKKAVSAYASEETAQVKTMIFQTEVLPFTALFLDDFWYSLVEWIAACEEDPLKRGYEERPWLWEFLPRNEPAKFMAMSSDDFQGARAQFEVDPNGFIESLKAYYWKVATKEACETLTSQLSLTRQTLMVFWIKIQESCETYLQNENKILNRDGLTQAEIGQLANVSLAASSLGPNSMSRYLANRRTRSLFFRKGMCTAEGYPGLV